MVLIFITLSFRRNEWLQIIKREDLHQKPSASSRVCEDHFDPEYVLASSKRKILKQNAVPRILSNYESRESQATPETADAETQYEIDVVSRKRKVNELSDIYDCNKKIKIEPSEEGETRDESESNAFLKLCDKFLNEKLTKIIKEHLKVQHNSKPNIEYRLFCLNLFRVSPEAYNLLKDTLSLSRKSALKSMYIPMNTKVNNHLMSVLKTKVDEMSAMERNCTLVMAKIRIKTNLFYNIKHDKIFGFHEVDGIQTSEPAKYAIVAMVNGVFVTYKLPVGYALVAECGNYEDILAWMDKLIQKLQEIGLNVRAFVSDMGSDFLTTAEKRSVSPEKPNFYMNNKNIYYIFDAPNLIKLVRHNLMNYDFHFGNHVAKWDHIVKYYVNEKDIQGTTTKLTESHINTSDFEKLDVLFAAQVLSATVAAGVSKCKDSDITDSSADGTVELLNIMNNLFDFLNSSSLFGSTKYQNAFSGEQYQTDFINDMLKFFASLKLKNRKNGKDVTKLTKFIKGFQITLKSVQLLFEDLKREGYTHILTRRFNQDCLGNIFGQIRTSNGKSTEPTSWQLVSALRKIFFLNITKPITDASCFDDGSTLLEAQKLYDNLSAGEEIDPRLGNPFTAPSKEYLQPTTSTKHIRLSSTDYNQIDLPERNALLYVCDYLLKTCSIQHKDCELMKDYLNSVDSASDFSRGNQLLIIIPQNEFISFVESMEEAFCNYFNKKYLDRRVLKRLLDKVNEVSFSVPCRCFPLLYCKKLYFRIRLYYTLKYNNRAFKKCNNGEYIFQLPICNREEKLNKRKTNKL